MDWKHIKTPPPEGLMLIINFKEGLKPCCGYTKRKKHWITKAEKLIWVDDRGYELDVNLISHYAIYEPPKQ
jgi:hypothetical protein